MTLVKWISLFSMFLMAAAIGWATFAGNFWLESAGIFNMVWGKVMLLDLYLGFLLFSFLIVVIEPSNMSRALWITALMLLGNLTAFAFVLFRFKNLNTAFLRSMK